MTSTSQSFRSLCPDQADAFGAWWQGRPPLHGRASVFVILDPLARGRARPFVGLDDAVRAKPRYTGYADAASAMMSPQ